MKKFTFLIIVLLFCTYFGTAQTTLAPGDIAFVALNSDEPGPSHRDDISFVLLVDIAAGTEIKFTGAGWDDATGFTYGTTDGHAVWTASSAMSAGTVVHIWENVGIMNQIHTNLGSIIYNIGTNGWSISGAGGQMFAFQGNFDITASFVAGIHFNRLPGTTTEANWDGTTTGSTSSALPNTLTNGTHAIWVWDPTQASDTDKERDNMIYDCSTLSGTKEELQLAINNKDNWTTSRTVIYTQEPFPCAFNVTGGCTDPTIPTVTSTPTSVCSGNTATLNISGSLNDATEWHIYTGSCGGTPIGTTGGSTFDVNPTVQTTYYIRGEGGCVTPGSCGSVIVNITPIDDASFSYSASSYCVDASDPTPTITGLAGGTFSSTAGLSINPGSGAIDVSTSTPGTYTVTYTTTGTCPNSANVSVTINALDDASFSYSASSYCVTSSDPTPTITGLAGGSFSSTAGLSINPGSGAIDVSTSTPGTYTVTYTTSGTCPNSSNAAVTINALDDASFNYSASAYCVDASDPTPTVTGLAGGSFSSTAGLSISAVSGAIDVSTSTPGTYTVTYTTTGTCPNSSNVAVTINALDDASFNYSASSYCVDATDPTPTIVGLTGGSFSSSPAGLSIHPSSGAIDVSLSTPNTYTVTYTTAGTCPNSANVVVTINALDNASFSYSASAYCVDASDPTPTVTGLVGGSFSSTAGLSINPGSGAIDVSTSTPGTYTVTYTTTGTCPNSANVSVTINALDDASFNYSASAYCVDASDPTPTVTGLAGGSFSSTAGLSINAGSGAIDVSLSTPGTYTVTYTTTGTCPNSANVAVTINTLDDASFSYSASAYCEDDANPTPTITGVTGGLFNSTVGLDIDPFNGTIDLSTSTPGTYTVTYTTSGTCPNSSNVAVTINALDDASFSYSASAYCEDDANPTPTITGLTGGGFGSTSGLDIDPITGTIDVSTSTPGTYTVTYITAGTCPNSSTTSVTINALDDASFSYDAANYCLLGTDPTPTITGLAGGTFTSSDPNLVVDPNTGVIDLNFSIPGAYTVTYTTTGTCPNSSDVSISIFDLDDASFNYGAVNYCIGNSNPTPTITGLAGGTFVSSDPNLIVDMNSGTIDLGGSLPGSYTVSYSTTGPCPNTMDVSVAIDTLDDASFYYSASEYCVGDSDPMPTITGLAGGTFASSDANLLVDMNSGAIDLTGSLPGSYTISYSTAGACPNTSDVAVTINALDDASFSYSDTEYCFYNDNPTPTITGVTGGLFTATSGLLIDETTGTIDLEGSNIDTYTVTYTTAGACPNFMDASVTIKTVNTTISVNDPMITAQSGTFFQWLDCNDNYSVIVSGASPDFTAPYNGDFAVEVTENGCIDTSACVTISTVGIEYNNLTSSVKAYPNPTSGQFVIEGNNITKIEVVSSNGTLVKVVEAKQNNISIDLSQEAKGIYFVKIISQEATETFKMLLE